MFRSLRNIFKAWQEGTFLIQCFLTALFILLFASLVILFLHWFEIVNEDIISPILSMYFVFEVFLFTAIFFYQAGVKDARKAQKIEEAEKCARENPQATKAAWELAQVKLESYLDHNLDHVSAIFWLAVVIMIVGFYFIGTGVSKLMDSPENFDASVLAAGSGVLINFIGATFLVIYKSTMEQATEYMMILERMNAVGMSVRILETVTGEEQLKHQAKVELSKQILDLYKK